MTLSNFLLVVILMALTDVFWTLYFIETEKRNAAKAALWSMMIVFAGTFATLEVIRDRHYIFASMIGAYVGTFLTVRFKK